jgi:primary-amine oxidase
MTMVEDRRQAGLAAHPLDMTTAAEVDRVRETLAGAGLLGETVRFAFFAPEEPPKGDVLDHRDGAPVDRRFRAVLLDLATGRSQDTVVSATTGEVVSRRELDPPRDGQAPIIDAEFEMIEDVLNADAAWLDALKRRGIDPASVRAVPLSAGVYDYPDEVGRRIVRAFGFQQDSESDHPWAHPVDGLVAYVDLTARSVDRVIDAGVVPVPATSGNFDDPALQGPPLDSLKPIEITQPEGRSFTVEGNRVRWGKWTCATGSTSARG